MSDDGWQPIETAPRDGTLLLIWDGAEREVVVGNFADGYWRHEPGYWPLNATHWRPLPAPPEG